MTTDAMPSTNDERGIPANKPLWKSRMPWEAYQAAQEDMSGFTNGAAA